MAQQLKRVRFIAVLTPPEVKEFFGLKNSLTIFLLRVEDGNGFISLSFCGVDKNNVWEIIFVTCYISFFLPFFEGLFYRQLNHYSIFYEMMRKQIEISIVTF